MSGRSRQGIQAELDSWYAARAAVARNQAYTIKDRSLTRANLSDINDTIAGLEAELARVDTGGAARIYYGVPG